MNPTRRKHPPHDALLILLASLALAAATLHAQTPKPAGPLSISRVKNDLYWRRSHR